MQQNQNNTQEIQGMNVSKSQVEDAVYNKFEEMMDEYGFDVDDIQGVYLHGSRLRGTANQNSDLDAVVFYIGNENEDYIFNTINDDNNQLVIDGVKVQENNIKTESVNDSFNLKQKQLDIINKSNPMLDDYHTGIRSVGDIMTLPEAYNAAKMEAIDGEWDNYASYPDITNKMLENALQTGEITIYSSYPIENGVFVTPSYQQALDYAGSNPSNVYSKVVPINNVAWVNVDEGQYAPVVDLNFTEKSKGEKQLEYSNASKLSFEEQIDLLMSDKWNSNASLILFKETPKLYQELGLSDNEITISPSKMKSIINGNKNHIGIGINNAKELPRAIANPLNIIESTTRDNSIVAITELTDANDNLIIVAMQIDGYGNIEFVDANNNLSVITKTTNAVLSSYRKNSYDSWINNHKKNIIYDRDDGIIKKRINGKWVQSPNAINSSTNDNTTNLPKNQVVLPINSSMQQNQNNTNNLPLAKVKQIRIHDFRHSFASMLISMGASISLISKYMGIVLYQLLLMFIAI